MKKLLLFLGFLGLTATLHADEPAFKSHLFTNGTLLYADDFDGDLQ
ncbi:MAG: hypothetical protein ACKVJX_22990 [Verrucomicrobiia bacterium]|jgi:hypothetical protein